VFGAPQFLSVENWLKPSRIASTLTKVLLLSIFPVIVGPVLAPSTFGLSANAATLIDNKNSFLQWTTWVPDGVGTTNTYTGANHLPYVNQSANQVTSNGDQIVLTNTGASQTGYLWNTTEYSYANDFSVTANWYLGQKDADGADGMSFVMRPLSSWPNGGNAAGSGNSASRRTNNEIRVEVDTYQNGSEIADDKLLIYSKNSSGAETIYGGNGAVLKDANCNNVSNIENNSYTNFFTVQWIASSRTLKFFAGEEANCEIFSTVISVSEQNASTFAWGFQAETGGANNYQMVGNIKYSFRNVPATTDSDTALSFNGSNQYAAAPSDGTGSIYDFGSAWTTQAWIKPGANCVAGYCNIIGKEYSFLISTIGNKLIFCTGNGSGWNIIWREAGGFIPTGAWSHVAATYSGTTLTIYLNGKAIHTSNSVAAVGNNAERFTIGGRTVLATGDASYERFQGEIDEVRVWNSARSQANIESDMHNRPTLSDANLKAYFDFNEGSGSSLINRAANSLAQTDLSLVGSPSWQDVSGVAVSGPYTIATFPRSYINSVGGWRAPAGVRSVRYLVVAGGGAGGAAGGNDGSGGGGAGGVLAGTFSLSASSYSVTVGAGGASSSSSASSHNPANFNGGNSTISGASLTTITSIGGGSGSSESSITRTASNGGSGGGAGGHSGTRGTGTAGQGNNGGSATLPGDGGGGGAGAPGGNGNSANGGTPARAGGIGILNDITGTNTYYGGGGGASGDARNGSTGGAGGLGGGGNGAAATSGSAPTNGEPNTGGGGGGAAGTIPVGSVKATGAGGSGIIILRWITATAPIFTGPTFDTLTAGLVETFTVSGSATSPLTRNFRWQVSTDTGTSWANATTGTGLTSANYITSTLETNTSGIRYQYRVVVTDSDTAGLFIVDTSTAVYLMINPRNTITSSTGSAIFTQKYGETRTAVFTFAFGTGPRTASVLSTVNNQNGRIAWSNLNSDSATVRVGTGLPVGTYYETLTVTDSVTAFTSQGLRITVSKADTITVTTTLSSSSVTYNESPANVTVTQSVTGLVNSETATVTTTYVDLTPCASGGSCKIGDVAPGGGKVFYVSATDINSAVGISGGGKYLATAPNDWPSLSGNASFNHQFLCYSQAFSGSSDTIGSGAANTRIIAATGCTGGAATVAGVTINGLSDWFIPSLEELKIMRTNLFVPGLATRSPSTAVYWSSVPDAVSSDSSYVLYSGGSTGAVLRGNGSNQGIYFMPIRAFNSETSGNALPTDAGTYRVGASYSLSSPALLSNYQGIESVTATLTINKAQQRTITIGQYQAFPNISSYPLNVYGGSGPGVLTRTLVSAGTAGCSLAATFVITATSVGTCTVKAEKAGTRNYIVESTTATISWVAWVDNYLAQSPGGTHAIPLSGGNQIIVRTETLTASAFSNETGTAISSARVGTKLRINSTGFSGLTPSSLTVTFRPYEDAVVTAVTSTYVEVVIPSGAVTGVIAIDSSSRGVAYTQSFTISP